MRVVARFTRGCWPTGLYSDDDYHLGAFMAEAPALHRHLDGGDDAILIGHDWGAWTTNANAALLFSPVAADISLALPPACTIDQAGRRLWRQLTIGAIQLRISWAPPRG